VPQLKSGFVPRLQSHKRRRWEEKKHKCRPSSRTPTDGMGSNPTYALNPKSLIVTKNLSTLRLLDLQVLPDRPSQKNLKASAATIVGVMPRGISSRVSRIQPRRCWMQSALWHRLALGRWLTDCMKPKLPHSPQGKPGIGPRSYLTCSLAHMSSFTMSLFSLPFLLHDLSTQAIFPVLPSFLFASRAVSLVELPP
jgi:hypothetical protein